jgi:ABC-type uncharacterized transport system substrate-binding protein
MHRREFLALLGGAAVACPLAAHAQQPAKPVIGFLGTASPGPFAHLVAGFIELLHELLPKAGIIALLINPTNQLHSKPLLIDLEAGARTLGLDLQFVRASAPEDFDKAYKSLLELRAGGVVIGPDIFFLAQRDQLVALAARHSMPAIYPWREGATAGGLMSYGSSQTDTYRQLGIYTGRILKGDKPADLPVQQSTKVEFIINLKTAKALGLAVPNTLIGRADELIE